MTVRAERLAKIADFIRERDFQAVKAIASVLQHFGDADGRDVHGCPETGIQLRDLLAGAFVRGADDRKGRIVEVAE